MQVLGPKWREGTHSSVGPSLLYSVILQWNKEVWIKRGQLLCERNRQRGAWQIGHKNWNIEIKVRGHFTFPGCSAAELKVICLQQQHKSFRAPAMKLLHLNLLTNSILWRIRSCCAVMDQNTCLSRSVLSTQMHNCSPGSRTMLFPITFHLWIFNSRSWGLNPWPSESTGIASALTFRPLCTWLGIWI